MWAYCSTAAVGYPYHCQSGILSTKRVKSAYLVGYCTSRKSSSKVSHLRALGTSKEIYFFRRDDKREECVVRFLSSQSTCFELKINVQVSWVLRRCSGCAKVPRLILSLHRTSFRCVPDIDQG